jgi:hypothetical protein
MNWRWHARSSRTRRSHLLTRQRPRRDLEISTAQSLRAFHWPIPPSRALSFWRPKGLANPVTTGLWQMFAKSAWPPRMQPCPWHSEMQWTARTPLASGNNRRGSLDQRRYRCGHTCGSVHKTFAAVSAVFARLPPGKNRRFAIHACQKLDLLAPGATPRASNFRGPPMAPCRDPLRSPRQSKQSKQITDAYRMCDIKRGRDYSVARIGAFSFPATEVD